MKGGEENLSLERALSINTAENMESGYGGAALTFTFILRGAWPFILLILISGSCVLVEALGILQHGIGRYLYIGACSAAMLLGLAGLIFWTFSELTMTHEALRRARLVASSDAFRSEVESKYPYFYEHWETVSAWAEQIAREMGLPEIQIQNIRRAAEVMDIGMLDLLDEIGEGPADDQIRRIIEKHPALSEHILGVINPEWEILPLVRHHHERFDGKGYPDGLKGEEIPIGSRIIALADSTVAMASDRPYRERLKPGEVLEVLKRSGMGRFDPKCVEAALNVSDPVLGSLEEPRKVLRHNT